MEKKQPKSIFPVLHPVYLARTGEGTPFYWPEREEDSYYLHYRCGDFPSKEGLFEDELLLVTPTGIVVNNPQIGPGHNFDLTWVRVTDHVVLLDPRLADEDSTEVALVIDLGIMPGWIGCGHSAPDNDSQEVREWENKYRSAFDKLAADAASSDEVRLTVLEGWATRANWPVYLTEEVANQALADFKNNARTVELVKILREAAQKAGLNWEYNDPLEHASESQLLIGPLSDSWAQAESEPDSDQTLEELFEQITAVLPKRMFNDKEKTRFAWPKTVVDSFYLVDASQELYLLCRPACLQLFHKESPVRPGDGFHFLRVSEHVVLQLAAAIENEAAYAALIEGLGLTIAKVPHDEDSGNRPDTVAIAKYIDWGRSTQELWRDCLMRGGPGITPDSSSHSCNSILFTWWLGYADWSCPDTAEVVRALAGDLATSPEWVEIERRLRGSCPNNSLDFHELELLGKLKRMRPATFAVGTAYPMDKASEVLRKIEARYKSADDKPAYTIDGACYLI
jgi:hypothetical protein